MVNLQLTDVEFLKASATSGSISIALLVTSLAFLSSTWCSTQVWKAWPMLVYSTLITNYRKEG